MIVRLLDSDEWEVVWEGWIGTDVEISAEMFTVPEFLRKE
jgi:hypothetical protein